MQSSRDEAGGVLILAGALEISVGSELKTALRECLAAAQEVTVDLSGVESCDAAALQLLCAAQKTAEQANQGFTFTGLSSAIQEAGAALGVPLTGSRP